MEHLLNLVWLTVVSALALLTARAHACGRLRCSLPAALGCVALMALVLFPALSMSDDLYRAKLYAEMVDHPDALLLVRSLDDTTHAITSGFCLLLLIGTLLMMLSQTLFRRRDKVFASVETRGWRPRAVRPPPAFAL